MSVGVATTSSKPKVSWKNARDLTSFENLIDYGVILKSPDAKSICRDVPQDIQNKALAYAAEKFCERLGNRYAVEIILETSLVWMSQHNNEDLVRAFLEGLFDQPNWREAVWLFVDIALTLNPTDDNIDHTLYTYAVAILCEIGLSIHSTMQDKDFKGPHAPYAALLDHIAAFLLSVSNSNDPGIRLSLFHYFGRVEKNLNDKKFFSRIILRFGQTVVDYVLGMLLSRRQESVVLQYILENLPIMIDGDQACQRILHESFKSHMLKYPDRFGLFLNTMLDYMVINGQLISEGGVNNLIHHAGILMKIASDVNHRDLGRELACVLARFPATREREEVFESLLKDPTLRRPFRDLLMFVRNKPLDEIKNSPLLFKSAKRGRKPALAKPLEVATLTQVLQLGSEELDKAS